MNDRKSILDDDLLQNVVDDYQSTALDPEHSEALFARVKARNAGVPIGTRTIRSDEGEWHKVTDKISIKVLYQDLVSKMQTALWRVEPGAEMPAHHHSGGDEECLVLDGEVTFGEHRLTKGDFHLGISGSDHGHARSNTGALLLIRAPIEPHTDFAPHAS